MNYCSGLQIPNDCQKLFVFHSFPYMDFIYTNRFYMARLNSSKAFSQILFLQILNCVPSQTEIIGYRTDTHVLPKL